MKQGLFFFCVFLSVFVSFAYTHAGDVYTVQISSAINPPVAGFIKESITSSQKNKAEALLIQLDTPGGLDTSMRDIVKNIMEAPIPVIVYVSPSGARAASAGSIILMSAHIAAMTPGTNVGAAHPVNIGGNKPDKIMEKKVVQDAEAYARSIALKKGRNAEWAAKSVTESVSVTAQEALSKKVIDIIAENIESLLSQIDGKTIEVKAGKTTLKTKGARLITIPMPVKYKFLSYISDPNVAYLLMMLGIYGILFELYSPGAIFPGIIGGISIILALYAFQTIPISFAGLALILLGILFFILEIKIISHGMLGIAGIASVVIGSIMLVDVPDSAFSISWKSIIVVAFLSAVFVFIILGFAVKSQLSKVKTGKEGLVGETGIARTDIDPTGKVTIHGEIWQATSNKPVKAGEQIIVVSTDRLTVTVEKKGG